ncbi:hypothetical protein [Neptuniibacter sp. QD37_11]|uniref:hypothetical protein n=1 Tax=Neptuniibacter sp. QD37_11 TaxID=3398209 RepID=UPI0039F62872
MKHIPLFDVFIPVDHRAIGKSVATFDDPAEAESYAFSDQCIEAYGRTGQVKPRTLTVYSSAAEAGARTYNHLQKLQDLGRNSSSQQTLLGDVYATGK